MPELPEVETVKETLKLKIIGKKIKNIDIYYNDIIENINVVIKIILFFFIFISYSFSFKIDSVRSRSCKAKA